MNRILRGAAAFQQSITHAKPWDPVQTQRGQSPEALLLTCADSRVVPHLFTGAGVGDIFVLRNAGNLVPSPGTGSSEEASIAFAIEELRVPHLIVCGHTDCGAMKALGMPTGTASRPITDWLRNARADAGLSLAARVEANVVHQLDRLESLPVVKRALEVGEVETHGWVYDVVHGELKAYDRGRGEFSHLTRPGLEGSDASV
jgi:carbonic anhydrase